MMEPTDLVEVLRQVPEAPRLQIYDLVWELVDAEGRLDMSKVMARMPDINLAEAEVRTHHDGINKLRGVLSWLMQDHPA